MKSTNLSLKTIRILFVSSTVICLLLLMSCKTHLRITPDINQYKDSLKTGIWISVDDTTRMIEICRYKNGELNGPYFKYFENGELASRGKYKNGKKNGWWYSGGAVSGSTKYRNGEIRAKRTNFPVF